MPAMHTGGLEMEREGSSDRVTGHHNINLQTIYSQSIKILKINTMGLIYMLFISITFDRLTFGYPTLTACPVA